MTTANKKKTEKKSTGESLGWKETFLDLAKVFLRNFFEELAENVRQKIELFLKKLRNEMIFLFMIILGAGFLMVGLAVALEDWIGFVGAGYWIMGLVLIFLGLILKVANRE